MDPPLPQCSKCGKSFFIERDLLTLQKTVKPLIGDTFFKYVCSTCAGGVAGFERMAMSWTNIIQLVLYHLHKTDKNNVGFFRWKEDICRMIDERWEQLCPSKVRTASWMNSVSSVLSANSEMFESGFERLKQPGWWALKTVQAPRPPTTAGSLGGGEGAGGLRKKRKVAMAAGDGAMANLPPPVLGDSVGEGDVVKKPDPGEIRAGSLGALAAGPPRSSAAMGGSSARPSAASASVDTAQTLLLARHYVERIPQMAVLLPSEQVATPTTMKAAQEIKRKLVERLLRVDSKLLQEALASSQGVSGGILGAHSSLTSGGLLASLSSLSSSSSSSSQPPPPQPLLSQLQQTSAAARFGLVGPKGYVGPPISPAIASNSNGSGGGAVSMGSSGNRPLAAKEMRKPQKPVKPPNYVRASPHENELLEKCIRVVDPGPVVNRFKRRLLTRRLKRRLGLAIFDFDAIMYKYLKSSDPLRLATAADSESTAAVEHRPGGAAKCKAAELKTFFDVPFHRDPSLSFAAKLHGISNALPSYPPETVSPFSGLRLARFLHREGRVKPLKLRLLEELRRVNPPYDDGEESVAAGADESTIDFVHVRKEWIPQVNRLLRQFFWPSVDMTESLDYPDYGVLIMYRKLVIGCAFMTPDGYITYFLVHPEWSSHGLGSILLHLMLERVAPRHVDVTLHVSVTNPALLLYQKFGFKPEEYVVNFYDKYVKDDNYNPAGMQTHSKNAFFVRRRRQQIETG